MQVRDAESARQRAGFDRLARFYDALLFLTSGNALHASQVDCLARIAAKSRILLVGGGTGRLAAKIARELAPERLLCVDLSTKMCESTERHLRKVPGCPSEVVQADIRNFMPEGRFDVVMTPYLLDVFSAAELPDVVRRLEGMLERHGVWLVADFTHPDCFNGPRRMLQKAVLALLYWFFRLTCSISARQLPDIDSVLFAHGFRKTWTSLRFFRTLSSKAYSRQA
ncbi:MAG TPA: class I SAM-dependent methyltransferase [Turneriella sp.]|nr:class I SAM-dependent methyltransferase [Turneriella sp.]HNE20278.1 class I SAM-dependent methyltransferase [Turneriella sp.]HNN01102.1 class I SAM-dependent methyltransferase [Turneriella sp.]